VILVLLAKQEGQVLLEKRVRLAMKVKMEQQALRVQRVEQDLLALEGNREALDPRDKQDLRVTQEDRVNVENRAMTENLETQALPEYQDLRVHLDKISMKRLMPLDLPTKDLCLTRDVDCIPASDLDRHRKMKHNPTFSRNNSLTS